jgi:hypothetical protein
VIGVGTPTDLAAYESEGSVDTNPVVRMTASRMSRFFGTTAEELAPWNPVALAPSIGADVMLIHESDDPTVPPSDAARFKAVRPTTQVVMLEAGSAADLTTHFVHGTISQAGRVRYDAAIGSFADHAIANRAAQRTAARSGCKQVSRSFTQIGTRRLLSALGCLARKDDRTGRIGSWRRSVVGMEGEVNAARLWVMLRRTLTGRRALAETAKHRTTLTVHTRDHSRVVLRHVTDATH